MLLTTTVTRQPSISSRRYSVLVLCTGNSARSIMAEALFNSIGQRWFHAFSAGSQPVSRVNVFALEQIERLGISTADYHSKNWQAFSGEDAPVIDFVITVCDNAAAENCPVFHGDALRIHWGVPDPAAEQHSDVMTRTAFTQVFDELKQRIEALVSMPLDQLNKQQVAAAIQQLAATKN